MSDSLLSVGFRVSFVAAAWYTGGVVPLLVAGASTLLFFWFLLSSATSAVWSKLLLLTLPVVTLAARLAVTVSCTASARLHSSKTAFDLRSNCTVVFLMSLLSMASTDLLPLLFCCGPGRLASPSVDSGLGAWFTGGMVYVWSARVLCEVGTSDPVGRFGLRLLLRSALVLLLLVSAYARLLLVRPCR